MKVRLNTNQRVINKQNYYDKLKNILERIDDNIEKTKRNYDGDGKGTELPESSKNELLIGELISSSQSSSAANANNYKKQIIICAICTKDEYKYICPKCKVKYCSVKCFKDHNIDCTENFYKNCVEEELKSTKIEAKEKQSFKRNIQNIFSKQAQEDEIYDQEKLKEINESKINHLEELLFKLNNNTVDLEKDLSKADWESFSKFMNGFSEDVYANEIESRDNSSDNNINMIKVWKPFWEAKLPNGFEPSLNAYDNSIMFILDEESKQKLKDYELNEFLEYQSDNDNNNNNGNRNISAAAAAEQKENSKFEFKEMKDIADEVADNVEDFNNIINNPNLFEEKEKEKDEILIEEDKIQFITLNNKKVRIDGNIIYRSILLKYENIPNLNTLSKITPNDKNLFTLIDLVLNMSYLFRLYNGELSDKENIIDIIAYLTHNTKVLYDKTILFENILETLNKFKLYVSTYESKNSKFIFELAIKDLIKIFQNKFFLVESMFRLYEIIHKFLKEFKSDLSKFNNGNQSDTNSKKNQELIRNLMLAKHKILYFLSYVKSVKNERIEELVKEMKLVVKENEDINKFGAKLQLYINKANK